jgi:hypothetical protein
MPEQQHRGGGQDQGRNHNGDGDGGAVVQAKQVEGLLDHVGWVFEHARRHW